MPWLCMQYIHYIYMHAYIHECTTTRMNKQLVYLTGSLFQDVGSEKACAAAGGGTERRYLVCITRCRCPFLSFQLLFVVSGQNNWTDLIWSGLIWCGLIWSGVMTYGRSGGGVPTISHSDDTDSQGAVVYNYRCMYSSSRYHVHACILTCRAPLFPVSLQNTQTT